MQKTLIVVIALFGLISASSLFRAPTTENLAVKEKKFTIKQADGVYRLNVDLKKDDPKEHPLLVALYSSEVYVNSMKIEGDKSTSNCFGMTGDICDAGNENCKPGDNQNPETIKNPYFTGVSKAVKNKFTAAYDSWVLDETAPSFKIESCDKESDKVNVKMFDKSQGILGLGFKDNANKNFAANTKVFSVRFDLNDNVDVEFSASETGIIQAGEDKVWNTASDANWIIKANKGIKIGDKKEEKELTVMFDINADYTGVVKSVYDVILAAYEPFTCDKATNTKTKCANKDKKKLKDLPKIEFLKDTTTIITLNPEDIIIDYKEDGTGEFELSLVALDNTLSAENHISAIAQLGNPVIFGRRYLKKYAVIFNKENSTISVYKNNLLQKIAEGIWKILKWVLLAIAISIVVCCLCVCFCCGGTAWIVAKLGKKDKQDNYYQSSQTDPFVARK